MKPDKISDAIGLIDDSLIEDAAKIRGKRKKPAHWGWFGAAAAACLGLVTIGILQNGFPFGNKGAESGALVNESALLADGAAPEANMEDEPAEEEGSQPLTGGSSAGTGQPASPAEALPAGMLACPVYPETVPFPVPEDYQDKKGDMTDWDAYYAAYDEWNAVRSAAAAIPLDPYRDSLKGFYAVTMREFLSGAEDANLSYSPLNLYMALGMLAELTDENSRAQILALTGNDGIESVRTQAKALWDANYMQDGVNTRVLSGSVWLDQDVSYVQDTLDTLAETYYASSFQGVMGSDAYNRQLQEWLNDHTLNLLKEQASQETMGSDCVIALASTVAYQAAWEDAFSESDTFAEGFYAPAGEVQCAFMHSTEDLTCYSGDSFTCVAKPLQESGSMLFILPDEGTSPEELLAEDSLSELLIQPSEWEESSTLQVHLSVPKFDISSQIDLTEGLKTLGVTDVFDPGVSDFSPLSSDLTGLRVSKASHASRVRIDEEGCEAAAYTVIGLNTTSMEIERNEIDFVLNRPFLFAITGAGDIPLFVGIVNTPAA